MAEFRPVGVIRYTTITTRHEADQNFDLHLHISICTHSNLKLSSYDSGTTEGIRGGYASAKQNFPRKTGTTTVRDHEVATRRADAAEPS
jgi:hypothetical protein